MITEETLRREPDWIPKLTGLPPETFWQLAEEAEKRFPSYERQRLERPNRQRAVGGGRHFDLSLPTRIATLLAYLRLHTPQVLTAKFFGAAQSDLSRDLRRLLPLLEQVLPTPEIWQVVETNYELTEEDWLSLAELADGQVLVDATEQQVYRSRDSLMRKAHYSGKKRCSPSKRSSSPMATTISKQLARPSLGPRTTKG